MKRIHLFEFEDQSWFPAFLRNYGTDFLQFLSNKTKMYRPIIPVLTNLLDKSNTCQIIDLGSGGGGGFIWLNDELKNDKVPNLKVVLTDYYPNITAFKHTQKQSSNFSFIPEPIDAKNVPSNLRGLRTMFLSFHHFKEKDAIQILQNAVNSKESIAIFEAQERSFASILAMLFSPISVLFATPFIKPFTLGRILFTYLIPIVPLFVLWDGVVSSFRTYSLKEMNELIKKVENHESYVWETNRIKSGPGVIIYLTGRVQ